MTNIRKPDFGASRISAIEIRSRKIFGIVNTFGDRPPESLVALFSSTGDLIISIVNGSAAKELKGEVGDRVTVYFQT